MNTNTRIAAFAATAILTLAGAPAFAQGYGSAAGVAASIGATASPPLPRGPFPTPAEPSVETLSQDVPTTGAIVRRAPHAWTRSHRDR